MSEAFQPATIFAGSKSPTAQKLSALLLGSVLVLEAFIFYRSVIHDVTPFYPINFDQLSYYIEAYRIIDKGWLAVIEEIGHGTQPAGVSLTVQGAILGLLFGANRTVLISINLIYFFALELVLYGVVYARTRSLSLAWISVALLICSQSLYNGAGGLYDFRIDFSALCLYGIWVCLVLWSHVFHHTGRAFIASAVAILLVSFRFLAILYVGAVLVSLLGILLSVTLRRPSAESRIARRRIGNLLAAGTVIVLFAAPLLYSARDAIYNYYIIGHVLGEEKYIRAQELGLHSVAGHLLYYPRSIFHDHLNWSRRFWLTVAILVAGCVTNPRTNKELALRRLREHRFDLVAVVCAVVAPVIILSSDISKSQVAGGVVIVPIVLLVTLLSGSIWGPNKPETIETAIAGGSTETITSRKLAAVFDKLSGMLRFAGVAGFTLIGISSFVAHGAALANRPVSELRRINALNNAVAEFLIKSTRAQPRISFDRVSDFMNWGTIILFGYEQFGHLIDLTPLFSGIFAIPRDVAIKLFMESDVIILTDPVRGRTTLPTDKEITEYWSDIESWTRQNCTLLYSTTIFGIPYAVYVRRSIGPPDSSSRQPL
jgi:hypothetical protein